MHPEAPDPRSAMPRVLGILMIVFGSLGALGMMWSVATSFGGHDDGYLPPRDFARLMT